MKWAYDLKSRELTVYSPDDDSDILAVIRDLDHDTAQHVGHVIHLVCQRSAEQLSPEQTQCQT